MITLPILLIHVSWKVRRMCFLNFPYSSHMTWKVNSARSSTWSQPLSSILRGERSAGSVQRAVHHTPVQRHWTAAGRCSGQSQLGHAQETTQLTRSYRQPLKTNRLDFKCSIDTVGQWRISLLGLSKCDYFYKKNDTWWWTVFLKQHNLFKKYVELLPSIVEFDDWPRCYCQYWL